MHRAHETRFGYPILLLSLFLYLMVSPFLAPLPYAGVIMKLSLSAVFLFAVYAVYRVKMVRSLSIILLSLTLLMLWLSDLGVFHFSTAATYFITALYLATLVYSLSTGILKYKRVTTNLLCATLCLYLIIGLLWGTVYALVERLSPGSFTGGVLQINASATERLHDFVYFSYVTLTTLGYGDITPHSSGAMALCQAEAILGQFYIAVLVAYLVAMRVSIRLSKGGSDE